MSLSNFRQPLAFTVLLSVLAALPACATPSRSDRGALGLSAPINGLMPSTGSSQASWSLPICGPVIDAHTRSNSSPDSDFSLTSFKSGKELKGRVSLTDESDKVSHRINELLDAALAQDPQTQVLDKAV